MTKQHFQKFADTLKRDLMDSKKFDTPEHQRTRDTVTYAAVVFADVAVTFNSRFDRARFMKACGL